MTDHDTARSSYILPGLQTLYAALAPLSVLFMRLIAGVAFMVHGWPKINAPMGAVGMVEGLGFDLGCFWAPLLAATEFLGGLLLAVGFLTRPAALATSISAVCRGAWRRQILGRPRHR